MTGGRALVHTAIRGYQLLIAPLFVGACRYEPTCSAYAMQAVDQFGPARGGWLAVKRIARCHPWGGLGFDPVPAPEKSATTEGTGDRRRVFGAGADAR